MTETASTIHARFYREQRYFELAKENIFARSWQFIGNDTALPQTGSLHPIVLLPGFLDEPLLLSRGQDRQINCLSNVCPHRGNLLIEEDCHVQTMRCRYHGRRFGLDGTFISAPGFEQAKDFPDSQDSLPEVDLADWFNLLFVNLSAGSQLCSFTEMIKPISERVGWMPLAQFVFAPEKSKEYSVKANWALYCENYLEGLHIPYVHPSLAATLDTKNYKTELFDFCNLQIGIASSASESFDLPKNHPDYGQNIAAYYFWVFPNMMFNFYPWGLSANIVQPTSLNSSKIQFLSYVWNESKIDVGAGGALDQVEMEDEAIVEQVQLGVRSRLYSRGRYSPTWERGVKHFHDLLRRFIPEID